LEEVRLGVFVNRMSRRIFGPKRKEVAGEWRRLHNEELHLYSSRIIISLIKIKEYEMGGACSTHGS
jgi:hypothetical protein